MKHLVQLIIPFLIWSTTVDFPIFNKIIAFMVGSLYVVNLLMIVILCWVYYLVGDDFKKRYLAPSDQNWLFFVCCGILWFFYDSGHYLLFYFKLVDSYAFFAVHDSTFIKEKPEC
jgi:hypothetical protein